LATNVEEFLLGKQHYPTQLLEGTYDCRYPPYMYKIPFLYV